MIWNYLFCFCLCFCIFIYFHHQYYPVRILSVHALVFPSHVSVFIYDLSPNTSRVCVCTIWSFLEFWYFLRTWFTSRFLEFPAAILICIVINSP